MKREPAFAQYVETACSNCRTAMPNISDADTVPKLLAATINGAGSLARLLLDRYEAAQHQNAYQRQQPRRYP